jgi:hypothetical protein
MLIAYTPLMKRLRVSGLQWSTVSRMPEFVPSDCREIFESTQSSSRSQRLTEKELSDLSGLRFYRFCENRRSHTMPWTEITRLALSAGRPSLRKRRDGLRSGR